MWLLPTTAATPASVASSRRCALRVAAGRHDARFRIEPMGSADEGTRRAVGLGRDAASVDDHHIGESWLALSEPSGAQAVGNGLAIGACGTAAKVLDVERSAHGLSLAESTRLAELVGLAGLKG